MSVVKWSIAAPRVAAGALGPTPGAAASSFRAGRGRCAAQVGGGCWRLGARHDDGSEERVVDFVLARPGHSPHLGVEDTRVCHPDLHPATTLPAVRRDLAVVHGTNRTY